MLNLDDQRLLQQQKINGGGLQLHAVDHYNTFKHLSAPCQFSHRLHSPD